MGLSPSTIELVLKQKKVFNELDGKKPLDATYIASSLTEMVHDVRHEAEVCHINKEAKEKGLDIKIAMKIHDADKLNSLMASIPFSGGKLQIDTDTNEDLKRGC